MKGEINKLEKVNSLTNLSLFILNYRIQTKVRQDDDVKSIQELNRVFGIGLVVIIIRTVE